MHSNTRHTLGIQLAQYGRGKLTPEQQKEHDKVVLQKNQKMRDQMRGFGKYKVNWEPKLATKKAELEKKEMQMLANLGLTEDQVKEYKTKEERRRIPLKTSRTTHDNRPRELSQKMTKSWQK